MSRWTPETIADLIARGRAGESWQALATRFYPDQQVSRKAPERAFERYATPADWDERQRSLVSRHFNKPKIYSNRGLGGGSTARPEPPLRPEDKDPWAGMGRCFA